MRKHLQITLVDNGELVEFWLSCSAGLTVSFLPSVVWGVENGVEHQPQTMKWGSEPKAVLSPARRKEHGLWKSDKWWVQIHHLALYFVNLSKFLKPSPHLFNVHNTLHTDLNEVIDVIFLEESLTLQTLVLVSLGGSCMILGTSPSISASAL